MEKFSPKKEEVLKEILLSTDDKEFLLQVITTTVISLNMNTWFKK